MKSTIFLFLLTHILLIETNAQTLQNQLIIEQQVEVVIPGRNAMKNEISFFIKDGKAKSVSNQQGMSMNVYYFDSTKTMHTVVDMAGQIQKREMVDAINKTNSQYNNIEVEYLKETKNIAGVPCKKAVLILNSKGNSEKRIVWYDPNTVLSFKYNFGVVGLELINGLPMQYENTQMGFKMIHTVKKIDLSTNITKKTFNLPSDD